MPIDIDTELINANDYLEQYLDGILLIPGHNPNGFSLMLLMMRDDLEDFGDELTLANQERLKEADRYLISQAAEIVRQEDGAIQPYRERHNIPETRWWWFLDINPSPEIR